MRCRIEHRAARKGGSLSRCAGLLLLATGLFSCSPIFASSIPDLAAFEKNIRPILQEYCYDCHADGANKGNVAFDELKSDQAILDNHALWLKALKNLRAGLMPPPRKSQPTPEQKREIEDWIKTAAFKVDPKNPDPGKVTVRRLNRIEYRNTVRDLIGVDFDTEKEFPPDDAGFGFDNIGDVLTLSPMLLEKYFAAAKTIVSKAVPAEPFIPAETVVPGRNFTRVSTETDAPSGRSGRNSGGVSLSYYEAAAVTNLFEAAHPGAYRLLLDFTLTERFIENQFDTNKCRLTFLVDGKSLFEHDYTREGTKAIHYEFDVEWTAGAHELRLALEPLTPEGKQVRSLAVRLDSVTVRGPFDSKYYVRPAQYARFFGKGPSEDREEQRKFAAEVLGRFAERAFRRPAPQSTLDRLVALAESTYTQPGKSFEAGISQAMVAVLASPRFLFREESAQPLATGAAGAAGTFGLVDEFTLASRLSYFLWSSMPDEELLRLAREGELRNNLSKQVDRMLGDKKSEALVRNFVGQWLQARDIDSVQIDARQVLARESTADPDEDRRRRRSRELRQKEDAGSLTPEEKKELEGIRANFARRFNRAPRAELNGELRRAMRHETEKTFEYVLREDRSLLELLDSDYTFLNERLATHYGLTNLDVKGDEMRLVKLSADSPRGGLITQGTVLAVTSNPTRTSPVKRGLFILDNLLGIPPAPPPPDIPALEEAAKGITDRPVTLRETLALHREQALCSSCHNRMDPLGLALENFNAMGMWRDKERGQAIDATGQLMTGESFTNVKELKRILATRHATEFYHALTEKLLTYALGRGLEYYDVVTVDQIVERVEKAEGRPSALLAGIIDSAPFQKTRLAPPREKSLAQTTGN